MELEFQTEHVEDNERLQYSATIETFDPIRRVLDIKYDLTTFDAKERINSLRKHFSKATQILKIVSGDVEYEMIVEPHGPRLMDNIEIAMVHYTIFAMTTN